MLALVDDKVDDNDKIKLDGYTIPGSNGLKKQTKCLEIYAPFILNKRKVNTRFRYYYYYSL